MEKTEKNIRLGFPKYFQERTGLFMILKQKTDRRWLLPLFCSIISMCSIIVNAGDIEAQEELKQANIRFSDGDYYDAGKGYRAAELYADSPDIKFQALTKAAESFGKANQKYKQFKCLEDLIAGFPDKINFTEIIDKEYEIANDFDQGHRDIPLSWLPWIKDSNKASEIYKSILKQAPFAKFAPALKLKLGRIYLKEEKNEEALRMFRKVIKEHPKTKEEKYARFELANALVQLSFKAGDGDGAYAREAEAVLKETLKIYPDDPETLWINQSIRETDDVRSERLYKLAEFYQSRDNPEAAIRYFNDLISRFPDSIYIADAEKHLRELDENYKKHKVKKRDPQHLYPVMEMKSERNIIITAPEASGGKWLLPIEDLDPDSTHADEEYFAEKRAKEEARKKAEAKRAAELAARKAEKKRLQEKKIAEKKAAEELKKRTDAEKEAKHLAAVKEKADRLQAEVEKRAQMKRDADAEKKKRDGRNTGKERQTEKTDLPSITKKNNGKNVNGRDRKLDRTNLKKNSSKGKYIIPAILLILLLSAMVILYLKKKKQV
jgi:outer membrane protein assembly factor BamD (BamD/ComL family)